MKPGDIVDKTVMEQMRVGTKARTEKDDYLQLGDQYGYASVPGIKGATRPIYSTYCRIDNGDWKFVGYCFPNEVINRA